MQLTELGDVVVNNTRHLNCKIGFHDTLNNKQLYMAVGSDGTVSATEVSSFCTYRVCI